MTLEKNRGMLEVGEVAPDWTQFFFFCFSVLICSSITQKPQILFPSTNKEKKDLYFVFLS